MTADNEVLWTVNKTWGPEHIQTYLFRTRYAARKYRIEQMRKRTNAHFTFKVRRAKWGPEQ